MDESTRVTGSLELELKLSGPSGYRRDRDRTESSIGRSRLRSVEQQSTEQIRQGLQVQGFVHPERCDPLPGVAVDTVNRYNRVRKMGVFGRSPPGTRKSIWDRPWRTWFRGIAG
jgi:hypothetical protein